MKGELSADLGIPSSRTLASEMEDYGDRRLPARIVQKIADLYEGSWDAVAAELGLEYADVVRIVQTYPIIMQLIRARREASAEEYAKMELSLAERKALLSLTITDPSVSPKDRLAAHTALAKLNGELIDKAEVNHNVSLAGALANIERRREAIAQEDDEE